MCVRSPAFGVQFSGTVFLISTVQAHKTHKALKLFMQYHKISSIPVMLFTIDWSGPLGGLHSLVSESVEQYKNHK